MHRATPRNSSFRAYTAGGARASVDKMDDSKLMQEMSGNFMHGENRGGIEAPQNYGFTSHNFPADKDAQGKITGSAESTVSFMGGNRSFPVAGPIDDRRHRLKGLSPGDTAMYRGKDDDTQLHFTSDGGYLSAPTGRTLRMQLVPQGSGKASAPSSGKQSQQGQQSKQQQSKATGQQAVAGAGSDSVHYVDLTKTHAKVSSENVHLKLGDKKTYVDVNSDKKVYIGGEKGKDKFAKIITTAGPSNNGWAKI